GDGVAAGDVADADAGVVDRDRGRADGVAAAARAGGAGAAAGPGGDPGDGVPGPARLRPGAVAPAGTVAAGAMPDDGVVHVGGGGGVAGVAGVGGRGLRGGCARAPGTRQRVLGETDVAAPAAVGLGLGDGVAAGDVAHPDPRDVLGEGAARRQRDDLIGRELG